MNEAVLQEIRKSHCARKGEEHRCAGSCKITPKGIELSCHICGNDSQEKLMFNKKYLARAEKICRAIGIDFYDLSIEAQERTLREIHKDHCPSCGEQHIMVNDYVNCKCGFRYSHYDGWKKGA